MSRSISIVRRKANLVDLTIRRRSGITGFRFSASVNFDATFVAFATVLNYGTKSVSVPDVAAGHVGSQFRDLVRFLFDPADYAATAPALVDSNPFYLRVESQNPDGSFNAPEAIHLILPPSIQPNRSFFLSGTAPAIILTGSDTNATVDTSVNDTLRIRANAADDYTEIAVTSGASTAKTVIRDDLNTDFISNNLPFLASIVGSNQLQIDSTTPAAFIDIDTIANGSILNTPLGLSDGATVTPLEIQLPMQCNDFEIKNDGAIDLLLSFNPTGGEYLIPSNVAPFSSVSKYITSVSQVFLRGSGDTTTFSSIWTLRNDGPM